MHFLWHADQPAMLILPVLLDDIDTGTGVAAGTDQDQTGFAHDATRTRRELLGILIRRRDKRLRDRQSMRGQSVNGTNSCIRSRPGGSSGRRRWWP